MIRYATVPEDLLFALIDLLKGRHDLVIDNRRPCVVPGCMVRSRRLTPEGMCPPHLWDERHDAFLAQADRQLDLL